MESPGVDPLKFSIFKSMLTQCDSVMVHFDPRVNWVDVPERFSNQETLVLRISKDTYFSDLENSEQGITAALTFGGFPYDCFIPFDSVFAMTDINGKLNPYVWVDSSPEDMDKPVLVGPPKLTLIQGGGQTTPPRRGHLKLVQNEG